MLVHASLLLLRLSLTFGWTYSRDAPFFVTRYLDVLVDSLFILDIVLNFLSARWVLEGTCYVSIAHRVVRARLSWTTKISVWLALCSGANGALVSLQGFERYCKDVSSRHLFHGCYRISAWYVCMTGRVCVRSLVESKSDHVAVKKKNETVQYLDCIPNTSAGQVKLLRLLRMIKLLRLNRLKQVTFPCVSLSVTMHIFM